VPAIETPVYVFSPFAIPTAATTLLMLLFGVRVLMRRVSRVSGAFFALTVFASIWFAAFTMMYLSSDPVTALRWARLAYFGVPFIAPAIYQFSVEMLRVFPARRGMVWGAWVIAAAFSAIALETRDLITGVEHFWWGYYPRYDVVTSIPFLLFFFGFLIAALGEFVRAKPDARGVERVRIRLLIVAFAIAYFGCVDFLAKFGFAVYPFGFLPIFGFVAVVAYVVRRYDLVPITPSLAANEIINTMVDVLFVCDRDSRIQFANDASQHLLGYKPDELTGLRIEEILASRDDDLNATLRRRSVRSAEYAFRSRDGEKVDLTLSISPVIHQGEAAGAIIIGRDMRERKRAEREARRAVTLLHSTLDSTADGILVTDDRGHILTYNQRFVDMWRIPQDIIDTADERLVRSTVIDQVSQPVEYEQTIATLYAQPEAESFELLEFRDGRRFERYSIGRTIEGIAKVRVWSFRDVTARFAAEAALRESEVRYRLLFEQNAAGVYVTNVQGEIVDCNSTFANLVGAKRNDLVGKSVGDLYERRMERDELASMLQDAGMLNGVEIELRRFDGARVWALQNLALVGQGENAMIHATVVDISDRKRAEEQIEFHAYHDVLTHLPNRRLFTDRLALGINRARRSGRSLAVMFIDLDHFKSVNDTLGHTAGDELLLEMSQRLRDCIREDDTVARLGGDEFTIILAELRHPEDAAQVAQKILETVQVPMTISGMPIEVSASIGIALYPVDGFDVETLLRNADSAMYRAKESGRNNYQLCTEQMKTRALERLSLETRLRKAMQLNQLILHYQPQVSLTTGRIIGVEALVRWNDPERGLIEPLAFIPMAEESRLIFPIGEWVLHNACVQAREWRDCGLPPMRMAVNLSARQFQSYDLADLVRRTIADARIDPAVLDLEITESTAMQNAELSIEVLRSLCDIGVAISIDDFGTGYSSLNYLKRFPINAVKVDRAFVNGVATNESDGAIVSAVIAIARTLRLRVVAEGVETEDQYAFLQRRQCDEAQGFYFSRPVDADGITRALVEQPMLNVRQSRLQM
jgi:diguanylate cyclase (GGDEF)-like protein/PAS domain S-box-containing protein